jgi:predicted MPP superfamily phosphohydrolase
MFGIVLTTVYTIMLFYVMWRMASIPAIRVTLSSLGLAGLGIALWGIFFIARYFGHNRTGFGAPVIESAGMMLLGTVFLISLPLFMVDLGTLFGLIFARWRPFLLGWALTAGVLLSAMALVQGLRAPAVVSFTVTLPSLPAELDGTVIAAISDTHIGTQLTEKWLAKRVGQIQNLQPDLVFFLGDIFEGHGRMPDDLTALASLQCPLGKWFVTGNHEIHGGPGNGSDLLIKAGFHPLDNQWAQPVPGLILCGVSDLTNHQRRNLDGDPLGRALANRPAGATVLLSHTPWQAERAAQAGVALMLSGHTHGGQIWPFGYLVRKAYPLFAGRYDVDGMTVLVSRGAGTWGPRMRLWHRGEILKITLESPKASPNAN